MRIGGMVESMEVGEQAGAYLVTPGTAPTLHARLRFRLLIRLLFPTLGRPTKELTDGSGHKGPSGTFGRGCLWEVQAGTVTRPQEIQNQSLASRLPTPGPDQPPTWPFYPSLPLVSTLGSLSLDVTLTSHLQPAWESCSVQGLCDMIQQRVDMGSVH